MMKQYEKTAFVRDLKDKTPVSSPFLVKFSAVAVGKNGKPYMNLVLQDKTGEIDAFLQVEGNCQSYQGRKQIVVKSLQVLREDEVKLKDYVTESPVDPDDLYRKVQVYIESMVDPYYKALAESVLIEDADIIAKFKKAPAAKSMHHAYPAGLLEHVVSITGILDHLAKHYAPYVDRDLMFLGGFFHDIGKLWELSYDRVTEYTTEGKLIGHLVMGVELVDRKIRELEAQPGRLPGAFPEEKKLLVKHIILSHHGQLEYGSPKRPKCLEALIVHYIDDLDSKVNSIRLFTEMDQTPGRWTGLNRNYERFFYKPDWVLQ
jgi:3'-5' exoribonuclease